MSNLGATVAALFDYNCIRNCVRIIKQFRSASRPYRLLDREEERPEDPRLRLLGLDRCTDGREAERDGRPMFDLLDDRGVERIVEVEPNVDPLERCEGLTLRRLTDGLDLAVERVRPSRGVDCLGLEGVRKIRGPEDREEFRVPRPSGRCPRDPPARPRSGWTRGAEGVTPVCLLELALELPLDRASGRSACARLGPDLDDVGAAASTASWGSTLLQLAPSEDPRGGAPCPPSPGCRSTREARAGRGNTTPARGGCLGCSSSDRAYSS